MFNHTQIIGSGGHAKVVIDALRQSLNCSIVVFDDNKKNSLSFDNVQLTSELDPLCLSIIAIGSNAIRQSIALRYPNFRWTNAIHPTATIHSSAKIGQGVYIGVGVVIQPHVIIGDHSIINTGAIIEHDVSIGSFCHIAPGCIVTGEVTIGDLSFLGAGTTVIPQIKIGENVIVGAGSTVIRDIPSHTKAVGSPCRVIQHMCSS